MVSSLGIRKRATYIGREGDPYINLCFSVLREAKRDNTQMWLDFKKEYKGFNVSSFDIALWVADWWMRALQGEIKYKEDEPVEVDFRQLLKKKKKLL